MSVDLSKLNSALIIICSIVVFIVMLLLFFVVLLRKRHNYYLQEKELLKAQFDRVLLQSQLEIQEQSFTQISAEIHDNIGQVLSLVRLNLNTSNFASDPEKLQFTDELLGKAIADLRSLSHNLNTGHILRSGFFESVSFLLKSLEQTSLYSTIIDCTDHLLDLPDEKLLILFRMVQEAVNNIVKHARATQISVEIGKAVGNKRSIIIRDNGIGIEGLAEGKGGLGIKNMQQRARLIEAEVIIEKDEPKGTIVTIFI